MKDFNENDKTIIKNLRLEFGDLLLSEFTDFDFLRWLRCYNYRLDIIVPKLKHHFRVLRSFDYKNYPFSELMWKYWPYGHVGFNELNNYFVSIDCFGRIDASGFLRTVSATEIFKNVIFLIESGQSKIRERERTTGRLSGQTMVVDFDGFSYTNLHEIARLVDLLAKNVDEHYAQLIRQVIVVNSPNFYYFFHKLVRSVLSQESRQKLVILGSNWKTEILAYIHPDALPVHWGGRILGENGDEKCLTDIRISGRVDPLDYWKPSENDPKPENLHTTIVHARRDCYLTYHVTRVGTRLRWYFMANKDYGFGVFFTENQNETDGDAMEMVYPYSGHLPHTQVPEIDNVLCRKSGFYKLKFSNKFSWFYKLKISYDIKLETE